MPTNDHRIVKTSRPVAYKRVSLTAALTGVLSAAMATSATILSGGLGLGALGLFVIGPVLVYLIWGRRSTVGAILAAVVSVSGLWILQSNSLLPPPLIERGSMLLSAAIGWPVLYVFSVLWRVRGGRSDPKLTTSSEPYSHGEGHLSSDAFSRRNQGWMLVEVSSLGRIRRILGDSAIYPDLRVGQEVSEHLKSKNGLGLISGAQESAIGEKIFVIKTSSGEGQQLLIIKTALLSDVHNETAAQEIQDRTNFFASLGHDLKSPLNAVIGFADMMEAEIAGPMPDPYREYPGLIKESGQTLLRLVEDMLAFARSEAGTYQIDATPMDIVTSGETVIRQMQAEADRAGVTLEMKSDGEVMAHADARAVQRIWDNLVSNAVKYSGRGQSVTLMARQRGREVQLSVTDRGAGMDAADLARVAKPFSQGRNASGRAGTGLGLAMVKRLADMHGGKVVIRTAPGEGTHVVVTLPAAEEQKKAAE